MPPRPAHKRAADSRAESSAAGAHKKTRFAEPADDPATFAEQVDAALEEPGARSTRRVRTDGYDSDSSDSADEGAPSAPGAAKDADVDDMFAVPDEDAAAAAAAPKKKEEFLRLGDIEGQEFVDEDEDEEDEEDEPEDEDDAERRKKAGMGFELSSFNMREEMEEGKFTEDGMYVRTVDRHGVHDKWMDGIDEKEVKQARRRKREREKAERERQRAEEKELEDMGGKEQLERDLLTLLKKGETVLEALQRLGAQAKKSQKLEKGYFQPITSLYAYANQHIGSQSATHHHPRWTSTNPRQNPSLPSNTSHTSPRCSCPSATPTSTRGPTKSSYDPCAPQARSRATGTRRPRT